VTTTAKKGGAKPAVANGNGDGPEQQHPLATLAGAIAYEQDLAEKAEAIFDGENYEGRITTRMLWQLRPLLAQPIPRFYIAHTAKGSQSYKDRSGNVKPWPPHDITGINGAQVQATRMSNVLGRQHWRKLARYTNNGQLVQVFVIVGNDLAKARIDESGQLDPNGAEILIVEDGWGAYNKGPDPANHYKGSETSAIKRVLARIGPGEEVYRQEVDLELQPEDTQAPAPEGEVPQVATIEADRAAHLRDLFDANADIDAKKLQIKLGALGVTSAKSVNAGIAALTPAQADELEQWLKGGEQS
jgi:hypothetical protein